MSAHGSSEHPQVPHAAVEVVQEFGAGPASPAEMAEVDGFLDRVDRVQRPMSARNDILPLLGLAPYGLAIMGVLAVGRFAGWLFRRDDENDKNTRGYDRW